MAAESDPSAPPGRTQMPRPSYVSPPALLVLHAVRVAGVVDVDVVARRTGVDQHRVRELLLDGEAAGWVTRVAFGGVGGWALTERGRSEDERRLREELDVTGARPVVEEAAQVFEPLNARLVRACTDWQLRPVGEDRLAPNVHTDPVWDAEVLDELAALACDLHELVGTVAARLQRFAGYDERYSAALARAEAGEQEWVAGIEVASCHTVWMQLHEDLLSTLGRRRDADTAR